MNNFQDKARKDGQNNHNRNIDHDNRPLRDGEDTGKNLKNAIGDKKSYRQKKHQDADFRYRREKTYYENGFTPEFLDKEIETGKRYKEYLKQDEKPHVDYRNIKKPLEILFVAQNPETAKRLAKVFEKYFRKYYKILHFENLTYLIYDVCFFDAPANIVITACHDGLLKRSFPEKYEHAIEIDPIQFFQIESKMYGADPDNIDIITLEKLATKSDIVVMWTDPFKEADYRCFEIIDVVYRFIKKRPYKQFYKADSTSLKYDDLINTFESLNKGPNMYKALAYEADRIFNLKVGVAFSKLMTTQLKMLLEGFERSTVSFGSCQTPALGLIYNHKLNSDKFQSSTNYQIVFKAKTKKYKQQFEIELKVPQIFTSEQLSRKFIKQIPLYGVVKFVKTADKEILQPSGLNTFILLKHASVHLNISSKRTMTICEKLYNMGLITYPRVDFSAYPSKFKFEELLHSLSRYSNNKISIISSNLIKKINRPASKANKGNNMPIIPTGKLPLNLSIDDRAVYEYIVIHFLASISTKAVTRVQDIQIKIGNVDFIYRASKLKSKGFLDVLEQDVDLKNEIFDVLVDDKINIVDISIVSVINKKPTLLTESQLIDLMHKKRIGGNYSIIKHIANLKQRCFIKISKDKKRYIEITDLGFRLVEFLQQVDPELVSADLRKKIYENFDSIATRKGNFETVLKECIQTFKKKYNFVKNKLNNLANNIRPDLEKIDRVIVTNGKAIAECGKCGKIMSYEPSTNVITCYNCHQIIIHLPEHADPLMIEQKCDEDRFQLIEYAVNIKKLDYGNNDAKLTNLNLYMCICPCCYNKNNEYSKWKVKHQCGCGKNYNFVRSKNGNGFFFFCQNTVCGKLIKVLGNADSCKISKDGTCIKCNDFLFDVDFRSDHVLYAGENTQKVCLSCNRNILDTREDMGKSWII